MSKELLELYYLIVLTFSSPKGQQTYFQYHFKLCFDSLKSLSFPATLNRDFSGFHSS